MVFYNQVYLKQWFKRFWKFSNLTIPSEHQYVGTIFHNTKELAKPPQHVLVNHYTIERYVENYFSGFLLETIRVPWDGILWPILVQTGTQILLKIFECNHPKWSQLRGDGYLPCKQTSKTLIPCPIELLHHEEMSRKFFKQIFRLNL